MKEIKTNPNLDVKELSFVNCELQIEDWKLFGELLSVDTNLELLNLSENVEFGDEGIVELVKGMRKNKNLKLRKLYLRECGVRGGGVRV